MKIYQLLEVKDQGPGQVYNHIGYYKTKAGAEAEAKELNLDYGFGYVIDEEEVGD